MENVKRFSRRSFLSSAALAVGGTALLAACSQAPAPAPTTAPAKPAAPQAATAPAAQPAASGGAPGKLVVWKFGGATSEMSYFPEKNDEFVKKTNIQLDYSNNEWSVKREKMLAAFQAKRMADVIIPDGQSIPDLVALGAISALDDIDKSMTDKWKGNFIPEIWNVTVYKGKYYALSPYVDAGTFMTYNKDMFKEAGITTVPTNFDEVREAAKKLTKPDRAGITVSVSTETNDVNTFEGIAYSNGGRWLDESGKKVLINDQSFIDTLQLFVDLINDKSAPQGPTETNFSQSGTLFLQSKAAIWVSLSYVGAFTQSQNKLDYPLGMVLFPRMAKPSGPFQPASMIMTPTAAFMVSSLSQQKDVAMKYIDFWAQPDTEKGWDGSVVMGRVPALKANWDTDTFKKTYPDWYQMYKDGKMFDGAQPMPAFPGLAEAEKALSTAMQQAVLGKMSPKDALEAAAKRAQNIVNQFQF